MMKRNRYENMAHLTTHDEVKFVIGSREDFDWALEQVRTHALDQRAGQVLFSPVWGALPPDELVRWILESGAPVRFQLQMHKIVWPSETRAV